MIKNKPKIHISLFGAPSSGKTTLMHKLHEEIKKLDLEVFIANEKIKLKAYEKKEIKYHDFAKIFSNEADYQWRALDCEDIDVIVSDSPIQNSAFYYRKYHDVDIFYSIIKNFIYKAEQEGHIFLNYFIMPSKKYEQNGRWQTESESKQIGVEMKSFLEIFYNLESNNILKGSDNNKIERIISDIKNIIENRNKTIDKKDDLIYNNNIEILKMN